MTLRGVSVNFTLDIMTVHVGSVTVSNLYFEKISQDGNSTRTFNPLGPWVWRPLNTRLPVPMSEYWQKSRSGFWHWQIDGETTHLLLADWPFGTTIMGIADVNRDKLRNGRQDGYWITDKKYGGYGGSWAIGSYSFSYPELSWSWKLKEGKFEV